MGRGKARDVFGEPDSLVTIEVSGRVYEVPADVSVQRALQYISLEYDDIFIDYGAFCWNNERGCCVCSYQPKSGGKIVEARICRATVFDGQVVECLPNGMRMIGEETPSRSSGTAAARGSVANSSRYGVATPVQEPAAARDADDVNDEPSGPIGVVKRSA